MKFTLSIALVMILVGVSYGIAQTKADAVSQLKNLSLVPIASVQRWQCIDSGTTNGTQWNCDGLQMIQLTLTNGTVLGPYVNLPATAPEIGNGGWVTMALGAPDPALLKRK